MKGAFAEMLREVSRWPRWMGLGTLDQRCADLAAREPARCVAFLSLDDGDPATTRGPHSGKEMGRPLRERLAEVGLVAYYPGLRLACVCVRPEGIPERSAASIRPWLAEPLEATPERELIRELAGWPATLSAEEMGARCAGLISTRPLLCAFYARFKEEWDGGVRDIRADARGAGRLINRLAGDGIISGGENGAPYFVRAFIPTPPKYCGPGIPWKQARPIWRSQRTKAARVAHWQARWDDYPKRWKARSWCYSLPGIALALLAELNVNPERGIAGPSPF